MQMTVDPCIYDEGQIVNIPLFVTKKFITYIQLLVYASL